MILNIAATVIVVLGFIGAIINTLEAGDDAPEALGKVAASLVLNAVILWAIWR